MTWTVSDLIEKTPELHPDLFPGAGRNEVQTLTLQGSPSSGTWIPSFQGTPTAALGITASAATVQSAFEAVLGLNFSATGGSINTTPVAVEFIRDYKATDVPLITINNTGLNGGSSPQVVAAESVKGMSELDRLVTIHLADAVLRVGNLAPAIQDTAARAWVIHALYRAAITARLADPAKGTHDAGETSWEWTSWQFNEAARIRDEALAEYSGYFQSTPSGMAVAQNKACGVTTPIDIRKLKIF
jgi:hypothetical protein